MITFTFEILNEGGLPLNQPMIISDREDELVSHTHGHGEGLAPQDYLDGFNDFINTNINTIAALRHIEDRANNYPRKILAYKSANEMAA